jgi:hypothetical protein
VKHHHHHSTPSQVAGILFVDLPQPPSIRHIYTPTSRPSISIFYHYQHRQTSARVDLPRPLASRLHLSTTGIAAPFISSHLPWLFQPETTHITEACHFSILHRRCRARCQRATIILHYYWPAANLHLTLQPSPYLCPSSPVTASLSPDLFRHSASPSSYHAIHADQP